MDRTDLNRFWTWIFMGATLAFLLACHLPSLQSPLFSVDDESLLRIPQLASPLSWNSFVSLFRWNQHIDYYPIRDLSYALDVVFWGGGTPLARVHQIVLFWLAAWAMNAVLLELSVPWFFALAGTIAWAVHPYHMETMIWLSSRKDVLALLFGLLSTFYFLRGVRLGSRGGLGLSLGFFICGLFSKASIMPLPAVAGIWLLALGRARLTRPVIITLSLALLVAGISGTAQSWFYSHVNDMRNLMPLELRLETSITALGRMVAGWFVPSINAFEADSFGEWVGNNRPYFFAGIFVWLTFLALLMHSLSRRRLTRLAALCSVLLLYLPISALLFPHRSFYSTRYLEPASLAAWLLLIISAARFWPVPGRRTVLASVALVAVMGAASVTEAQHWQDPVAIRLKALAETPESLSLKSYALNEVINALRVSSESDKARLLPLRNLLRDELTRRCEALGPESEHSPRSFFANCHAYFRTAYLLARWRGNWPEADRNFAFFEQAERMLTPPPKMLERMRFETMLLKNTIDPEFVTRWLNENPYQPNPDYRILHLVGHCLLEPGQSQAERVRRAVDKHLLDPRAMDDFVSETVARPLQPSLRACLGLAAR